MKTSISVAFPVFFAAWVSAYDVPSLTPDNYDEMTNGKIVFLKFFAPGCKYCKAMAPDWLQLAEQWKDHEVGFVGEVDCTAEGKLLCDENGVRGYPTLKFGDPANLEEYRGSRSFDELQAFAVANLKPICSLKNMDFCDEETKQRLQSFQELSLDELQEAIKKEEEKLQQLEADFRDAVSKLQDEYQKLSKEKDEAISAVKTSGLVHMKSILSAKEKTGKDEL